MDVRETPISDSDIQCFNITTTLREIQMDCPAIIRKNARNRFYEPSVFPSDDVTEPSTDGVNSIDAGTSKNGENKSTNDNCQNENNGENSNNESDCSSDSEDNNSNDDTDTEMKTTANRDEYPHCIRVVLRNRENNNSVPTHNERIGLRCVIGIINGRGKQKTKQFFFFPFLMI